MPVGRQNSPLTQSPEQEDLQVPVGRQNSTNAQPSALEEMEEILARQSDRLEREINLKKANGTGKCGQIFKIAQAVQGPKKTGTEAHSVKDLKTGELVVSTKEIQKVFLNNCKEVLESNPVEEGYEEEMEVKEILTEIMLNETT